MIAGRDAKRRMRRALAALPPLARDIFALHAMQKRSFAEIAEGLAVSVDDVGHLLATALIALDRARTARRMTLSGGTALSGRALALIDGASAISS